MQIDTKIEPPSPPFVLAVVANRSGEIFELDDYAAIGMANGKAAPLTANDIVKMPHGSELMRLPQRRPLVYNLREQQLEILMEDPYTPGEPIYPVAVFNSPGYMVQHICAYEEQAGAGTLPMFSYGAVGWYGEAFHSAAMLVDAEPRQDLRKMPPDEVQAGIRRMRHNIPNNRLRRHLETCALDYGCPAAKNFFLGRFEAPLPTSQHCNARCRGCLSLQSSSDIVVSQERIRFTPTADEIAQVALAHMGRTVNPVVSFGQGCEGDPLTAAQVIGPAIGKIRSATPDGTIHMNTNASQPDILKRLFSVGLDSIRISMNSVRPDTYEAYFRPNGYRFDDVLRSIDLALDEGRFVAINYLNSPGVTDALKEVEAFVQFIRHHPIHMIQWRNLNFDPYRYWRSLPLEEKTSSPVGMGRLLNSIKKQFPEILHGYFNPPKERWPPSVGYVSA